MSNSTSSTDTFSLTCLYQNVRGLNTKSVNFYKSIHNVNHDIIAITESWLQNNISSSELFDDRFSVFRCDRDLDGMGVSRGGGTILAIKRKFKPTQLDLQVINSNVTKVDIVGCKLQFNYTILYIFALYIPPNLSNNDLSSLCEYLESLYYLYGKNLVIIGDFNIPTFITNDGNTKTQIIKNLCDLLSLNQFNSITNTENKILDLILSNIICTTERDPFPLVPEDPHHPTLNIVLSLKISKKEIFPVNIAEPRYNFRRANFPLLYDSILHADWSDLSNFLDVDEMCSSFYNTLYKIFDLHVPKSVIRKRNFPVWFTSDIIKITKRKHRIFKKLKRTQSQYLRDQYNFLRSEVKRMINAAYNKYIRKVESSITNDPVTFWSYIRSKNASTSIPEILTYNETQYSEPQYIVNAFANFFSSVYDAPKNSTPDININQHSYVALEGISDEIILKSIKKLKNKTTQGPDKVPCFLVKDCAFALLRPLYYIFNLSLKSKIFPSVWKEARITPIFKKGNLNDITNYRPISILSAFAKVFEMSVYECVFGQVSQLVSPYQHGFFTGRSTVSNLACFTQYVGQALDNRLQVDVLYTDFSKAFDKVDHSIFLKKIDAMGFSDNLVAFFSSYLKDRKQYVELRGHRSPNFCASSGAPQGSNLAPLIFLLFINDINKNISSQVLMFADDLKIFRVIRDVDDCHALQHDLSVVEHWCLENNLPLNINKCCYMTFSNKVNNTTLNYELGGSPIVKCSSIKDLGVTYDPKLSFTTHIDQICTNAIKVLGFIIRNCRDFQNLQVLKTLFFTYTRSKLEYGSLIWHPIYDRYTVQLENVQRKFVKFLAFKIDGVFPPRGTEQRILLQRFQLPSLINRRNYLLTVFLLKILKTQIDCSDLLAQIHFYTPPRPTRSPPVFYLPTPTTNFLIKTPIYRAMNLFNIICRNIDVHELKTDQLMKILKRHFLS